MPRRFVVLMIVALVVLPAGMLYATDTAAPGGALVGALVGAYDDAQLAAIGSFTLPRTFLYDRDGELIPQDEWPTELDGVKKHAGDAYCCVSDTPVPPGHEGPPPDCEKVVYGTDVLENFQGLSDPDGQSIDYADLPSHEYLLVEYYAAWCPPCKPGRQALESFFATASSKGYVWVVIDMTRLPEAQEAAKAARSR